MLEHGGGHGHGSSASPERDLLRGFSVSSQAAGVGTPRIHPRVSGSAWGAQQRGQALPPSSTNSKNGLQPSPSPNQEGGELTETPRGIHSSSLNSLKPKPLRGGGAQEKEG